MLILEGLEQILTNTPFWVWVMLIFLIKRGIALKEDGVVSLGKAGIMPLVFIVWGLERLFSGFRYAGAAFMVYLLMLVLGTLMGLWLYGRTQGFYYANGVFMRKGSWVPLVVIMTNFSIKYCLNVALNVKPDLLNQLGFDLVYAVLSGFTVGLFIGGILNTLRKQKQLEGSMWVKDSYRD